MNLARESTVLAALACAVLSGCATDGSPNQPPAQNASMSVTAPDPTAEALREVLQDERRARTFYTNVMTRHGRVRPYTNIVQAEARHESAVISLMNRYNVPVPAATPIESPVVPDSLTQCATLSASLERDNIAMYDRLLAQVKEDDIRVVFSNLRAVSLNNHLPAFERFATNAPRQQGRQGRQNRAGQGVCCDPACCDLGVCPR